MNRLLHYIVHVTCSHVLLQRPDVVLELAWKNKLLEMAFPYMIQVRGSARACVDSASRLTCSPACLPAPSQHSLTLSDLHTHPTSLTHPHCTHCAFLQVVKEYTTKVSVGEERWGKRMCRGCAHCSEDRESGNCL